VNTSSNPLLPLVAQLKACPAQDSRYTEERLAEAWERFKQTGWDRGAAPTSSVFAGLLVHDELVAKLLAPAEHAQLLALCELALERYQVKAHPQNPLGKTLAATLKELL
jgi:hypothetical protein